MAETKVPNVGNTLHGYHLGISALYQDILGVEIGLTYWQQWSYLALKIPHVSKYTIESGAFLFDAYYFPILPTYRQTLFHIWKRPIFFQIQVGGGLVWNSKYNVPTLSGGCFMYADSFPETQKKVIVENCYNRKVRQFFGVMDIRLTLGIDVFKWLTIQWQGGYIQGFVKNGEMHSRYQISGSPIYEGTSYTNSTHWFMSWGLYFRPFAIRTQKRTKEPIHP